MIALGRNLAQGNTFVRSGAFAGWRPRFYGRSLDGSTVGIVGAGAVGKAIARRLAGFRCHLLYYDAQRLAPDQEDALRLQRASLADLRACCDFVVLALPLTEQTFHLVDAEFLAGMKPASYLINPARGSLVDETAVADALESGHLAGYAADTFECEEWARPDRPDAVNARLLDSEHSVLTPHLGSAVDLVRREIAQEAAESVVQCLRGERPKGAVNAPVAADREARPC
jgi:phosphonate dehydrogenase